jgi:hypothetical protein
LLAGKNLLEIENELVQLIIDDFDLTPLRAPFDEDCTI